MKTGYSIPAVLLAVLVSGCTSATDATHDDAERCPNGLEIRNDIQNLGASAGLVPALRNAASGIQLIALGDITRAAGLADDWDLMTDVTPNISEAELNTNAGTTGCWRNLPESAGDRDIPSGYYIFVKDRKLVQVVPWHGGSRPLELRDRPSLTRESVLLPQNFGANSRLVPQP
ncbi:hypothetical protein ACFVUS_08180 [Nocardia sp. NPDC058058]|uniref:hypothetical protein n=1 Tax=Nocardia sp. NPDC058058 TaxID=3346317 RepID=UPI0036DD7B6C